MIRPATLDDVERLVEFGEMLHAESEYARHTYSRDKVASMMCGLIGGEYGVVFVAESGGEIIGAIAGGIDAFWFGDTLHAFDFSFYVLPDKRGGSAAFRLLLAFEHWAKAKGAVEIDIGITTGISEDKTQRFYEKMGYVQTGRLFGKALEVGHGT